jgi:Flp pilus assembly secretin CpaC
MQRHSLRWLGAFLLLAAGIGVTGAQTESASDEIILVAGRSAVIKAPWPTVRVAVTDPKIADVQVLTPEQVLVQGLKVGSTDLILWSEDEQKTWQRGWPCVWMPTPSAPASRGCFRAPRST